MTPAEVIREGRALLFERGWRQGGYENADGNLCMLGALNMAVYGRARLHGRQLQDALGPDAAIAKPEQYLLSVIGGDSFGPWNDATGRTFDEVIEAFDKAEKIAERDES